MTRLAKRRRGHLRRRLSLPLLVRTLAPGAYGAALLARAFTAGDALRPLPVILLLGFIAHLSWRLHALLSHPAPPDGLRVEVGVLGVLGLATCIQVVGLPLHWAAAAYGALVVACAAGVPLPGLLALPAAALPLWQAGPPGWAALGQLAGLALVAGTVALFQRRRQRRLQLALDKLRLDTTHLEATGRVPGAAAQEDLQRLDDVLYDYLDEVRKNAAAHGAVLVLRDPRGGLFVRELVSDSHSLREDRLLELTGTAFLWILERGKPLRVGHLRDPAGRLGYYSGRVAVKSFLGVPVWEGERVEGILGVDSLRENAFGEAQETMLKVAAHQVATILGQTRSLGQIRREARDFKALHEFSKHLADCDSAADVLDVVLASLQARLAPEFSALAATDELGVLRLQKVGEPTWRALVGREVPVGEGLVGWVFSSRRYLQYGSEADRKRRPLFGSDLQVPDFASLMLQPLAARGHSLGVLVVGSSRAQAFDSSAFAFSEILAQQGAQGLLQIQALEQLKELAATDSLTHVANRRSFMEQLTAEVARSHRYEAPLSLIVLDVDHFKQVNDAFGHPAGDEVLRQVARTLQRLARETDLVARYGGEEFALLLTSTDEEGARAVAERVRRELEGLDITWEEHTIQVRASFGVAALAEDADDGEALIGHADRALYAAKEGGRNRVVGYSKIRAYGLWS